MSVKALLIGPGAGLILAIILYSINGWRAIFAGFGISVLFLIFVLWREL